MKTYRTSLLSDRMVRAFLLDWRGRDWPTFNRGGVRPIDYAINERAAVKAAIEAATEKGYDAIVRDGMDCDCMQYHQVAHVPAPLSVFAFCKAEDDHRKWLDGPESMQIAKPSDYPEPKHISSDRALAAYEDGHASYVTYAPLEELR